MPAEKFYFPPFHPGCRCTVVAIRNVNAYVQQEIEGGEAAPEAHNLLDLSKTIDTYGVDDGKLIPAMPTTMRPTDFLAFDSLAEATDYYASHVPGLELEIGGVEESVALEALNQFERLRLTHPAIAGRLESIAFEAGTVEEGTLNSLAWASNDGSRLVLNSKYFRNPDSLKEVFERNIAEGVFVSTAASPIAQTVTHEAGHLLYASLSAEQKAALQALFERGAGSRFSLVAAQDANEMFAEAFTAMRHGGKVTEETAAIKKILERKQPVSVTVLPSKGIHHLPDDAVITSSKGVAYKLNEFRVLEYGQDYVLDIAGYQDWRDNLMKVEEKAIVQYKKGKFDTTNAKLRVSAKRTADEIKFSERLDKLFRVQMPESVTAWRVQQNPKQFFEAFGTNPAASIGKTVVLDKGIMSSTFMKELAYDDMGKNSILYEILVPKGSKNALYVDAANIPEDYRYGAEVLFKAKSKFKLIAYDETRRIATLLLDEPVHTLEKAKTPIPVALDIARFKEYTGTAKEVEEVSNRLCKIMGFKLSKDEIKILKDYLKDGTLVCDECNVYLRTDKYFTAPAGAKYKLVSEKRYYEELKSLFKAELPEDMVLHANWSINTVESAFGTGSRDGLSKFVGKTITLDAGYNEISLSKELARMSSDDLLGTGRNPSAKDSRYEEARPVSLKLYMPKGSKNLTYIKAFEDAVKLDSDKINIGKSHVSDFILKPNSRFKVLSFDADNREISLLLVDDSAEEFPRNVSKFDTRGSAHKWALKNLKYQVDLLTEKQLKAIKDYKDDELYVSVNDYLRKGVKDIRTDEGIATLDSCFAKQKGLPEPIVTYRGKKNGLMRFFDELGIDNAQDAIGKVIADKGYASTALHDSVSDGFAVGTDGTIRLAPSANIAASVRFEYHIPKGSKSAIYIDSVKSHYQDQVEVLLKRGAKFKVTDVKGDNYFILDLLEDVATETKKFEVVYVTYS